MIGNRQGHGSFDMLAGLSNDRLRDQFVREHSKFRSNRRAEDSFSASTDLRGFRAGPNPHPSKMLGELLTL